MSKEIDFEKVGFSNNFVFGKIMENPDRAKAFLEQILHINIHHIEYVEREKGIDEKLDGRSIRMDIYANDGQTVYDCEMQTTNTGNLPKRSRYYQSLIDIGLMKRNDNFRLLKKSFVIFVCTFDPFGKNQYLYTFENVCREVPGFELQDESYKIFVNTKGFIGCVSDDFKELLRFIDTSEDRVYGSELANELLLDLKKIRNNSEWRDAFMTWTTYGNDCREEGREEGRIEGREEGRIEGREEGRIDDIRRMLLSGKTPKQIADFCGYDLAEVEAVFESLSTTD